MKNIWSPPIRDLAQWLMKQWRGRARGARPPPPPPHPPFWVKKIAEEKKAARASSASPLPLANASRLVARGVMHGPRRSMCKKWRETTWSLLVYDASYRMQCFAKLLLERDTPYMFISHAKMLIVFGTGRPRKYLTWKPTKEAKFMLVLTREQMSHVRVQTTKTLAKIYDYWLIKTNYDTETNAGDVEKINETNNMRMAEDTQQRTRQLK